jgi:hypothetical protein
VSLAFSSTSNKPIANRQDAANGRTFSEKSRVNIMMHPRRWRLDGQIPASETDQE